MSEVGIPAARKSTPGARSRYTVGTVCQRQVPEVGIPTLFSTAYWHRNDRVIEIQTRKQLKNNVFHEAQRIFMNKFCIWTPSGQRCNVGAVIFQSYVSMLNIRIDTHHLCLASIAKFYDGGTLRKMLKRWWGRLEKRRVATESGGDETGDETGGPGGPGYETGDKIGDDGLWRTRRQRPVG